MIRSYYGNLLFYLPLGYFAFFRWKYVYKLIKTENRCINKLCVFNTFVLHICTYLHIKHLLLDMICVISTYLY